MQGSGGGGTASTSQGVRITEVAAPAGTYIAPNDGIIITTQFSTAAEVICRVKDDVASDDDLNNMAGQDIDAGADETSTQGAIACDGTTIRWRQTGNPGTVVLTGFKIS